MLREDFPEHGIDTFFDPGAIHPGPPAPKDAVKSNGQSMKSRQVEQPVKRNTLADIIQKHSTLVIHEQPTAVTTAPELPYNQDVAKRIILQLIQACGTYMPHAHYKDSKVIAEATQYLYGGTL
jgi:hypothetical protein